MEVGYPRYKFLGNMSSYTQILDKLSAICTVTGPLEYSTDALEFLILISLNTYLALHAFVVVYDGVDQIR